MSCFFNKCNTDAEIGVVPDYAPESGGHIFLKRLRIAHGGERKNKACRSVSQEKIDDYNK